MTVNNRSRRQLAGLRRAREWHLEQTLRAKVEVKEAEAEFYFRHYDLLEASVQTSTRS